MAFVFNSVWIIFMDSYKRVDVIGVNVTLLKYCVNLTVEGVVMLGLKRCKINYNY